MPILLGSQQDLWLAGRSERPHKVAGSWPDGLHVASSCNSRAVQCLIRACSVPEGLVTWDQHEGEGRTARYIRVDNAPASCFRDPRFMSGHRNGLCWISLFMVAPTSSRQMLGCCVKIASNASLCILQYIYRVSQEECVRLREDVPYVKVYRYNPKHLCPKLNGYGDNGQRSLKLWQLLHTYWLPNTY